MPPTMKSDGTSTLAHLRPLERVLAYLESNMPTADRRSGVKIPTTRELSRLVNVSSGTVRKAYQHLAQQGLIQTEVGSGTFWTPAAEQPSPGVRTDLIGLNVPRLPSGQHEHSWSYRIYGGMLNALIQSGERLLLQPLDLAHNTAALDSPKRLDEILNGLGGFISFPTPSVPRLDQILRERSIPHITLNPICATSTTRFASPAYFDASRLAGRAFARAGRQRTMIFLSPGTEISTSCQLRLSGFVSGLHLDGGHPDFRRLIAPEGTYSTAKKTFEAFLKEGWIPDAVYTAGDEMAHAVIDVAKERGISIPEEMSVIGGSGTHRSPMSGHLLTAMMQPLETLGEELINLLLQARRYPHQEVPGKNLPMKFTVGTTTLPQENATLKPETSG